MYIVLVHVILCAYMLNCKSFVKILRMYLHGYNQNSYTYITVLVHVHLHTYVQYVRS